MILRFEKSARLAGLLTFAVILAISSACKKEKNEPSAAPAPAPFTATLVASANFNFITNASLYEFKCYKKEGFGEAIMHGDTLLVLRFLNGDTLGNSDNTNGLSISIDNLAGFNSGDIYTETDNPAVQKTYAIGSNELVEMYVAGNGPGIHPSATFKVSITSITENYIKGTFKMTGYTLEIPGKELIISNGVFESELVHQ